MSATELLAALQVATRFRVYLASKNFLVIVDHNALTSMAHNKSSTSPRLQRCALFMIQFTYEIVYNNKCLHSNADGLSRMTYEPAGILDRLSRTVVGVDQRWLKNEVINVNLTNINNYFMNYKFIK